MNLTPAVREKLVQELKAARERVGASQDAVARVARVSQKFISAIELGQANATRDVVLAYARVCGMDRDAVCRAWGITPPDIEPHLHDPQVWALIRSLKKTLA